MSKSEYEDENWPDYWELREEDEDQVNADASAEVDRLEFMKNYKRKLRIVVKKKPNV